MSEGEKKRFSVVQGFVAKWRSQIPDQDKPGVWRGYDFAARFKLFPQTEDMRTTLRRMQDDQGNHGFLDHAMVEVTEMPPSFEFADADGNPLSDTEGVKQHLIVGADAVLAFWDTVNKGVEEKNLKKSRAH